MEAEVVHSSQSDAFSKRINDPISKVFVNSASNRKRGRAQSPRTNGNGPQQRRKLGGNASSQKRVNNIVGRSPSSQTALSRVQARLNAQSSDSEPDAAATPKRRRLLVQSSSPGSPDPIDALTPRTSPVPNETEPWVESTPRPRKPPKARDASGSPSAGRSKGGSKSAAPKSLKMNGAGPTPRTKAGDRQQSSSILEQQPFDTLFARTSTSKSVSTSVVTTKGSAKSQGRSLGGAPKKVQKAKDTGAEKGVASKRTVGVKRDGARERDMPRNRFSDDESELQSKASKTANSSRATKGKSKLDREASAFLDGTREDPEKQELAKKEEEKRVQREFAEEDRHRKAAWRGAAHNTREGQSFFASASAVDIADTEHRIARAQAAIDARTVKLSQETFDDDDDLYCARFRDYEDLCDVCNEPMPKNPSGDLVKLRKKLERGAHKTQAITFCTMHRAETRTLPLGWREGYPKALDFENVDTRLEESFIRDRIRRVVNRPSMSKFFRRAVKDIGRIGLTRWQSISAQSSDSVLTTATPGYYGDLGRAIIIHHYQHLMKWKLLSFRSDIHPLSPADFIVHVLVPEAAILLIMEDEGWEGREAEDKDAFDEARSRATQIHRRSGEYGRAAFREDRLLGREVFRHLDASKEAKRKMLERRAREEASSERPHVIEIASSDPVDPSSDYGDDPLWLNDALEACDAFDQGAIRARPKLPSTVPARMAKSSLHYR